MSFQTLETSSTASTLEHIDSWTAFKYHYLLWRFCGINPPVFQNSTFATIYKFYALILNFCACILMPLSQIIQLFYASDYLDFCENLYILIPDTFCIMKFIYVWYRREMLQSVRLAFAHLDRRAQMLAEQEAIASGIDTVHRAIIWIMRVYLCAILNHVPFALIANKRRLIVPAWFPWNWRNSRELFVLTYTVQLFAFMVNAVQDICNDTYPHAFLTIIAAHIRALAVRIEHIGQRQQHQQQQHMSSQQLAAAQELAYEELVDCIEDHKIVLAVLSTIDRTISMSCFFQFINTAIGACAMGVYCSLFEMNFSNIFTLSIFLFAICLETFILCYSGDVVCAACEDLTRAIYACNWTEQHIKFRRTLLMLLRRSQKSNSILAGGFIPVRIPTFVMVMKVAYSMFTVLAR